jgi:hypothetical protein
MSVMAVDTSERLRTISEEVPRVEGQDSPEPHLSPRRRAEIQMGIVAQREELQSALARVLRERWRQKAAIGRAAEDRRGSAGWLDVVSEHALRSVGEEHEADRQFALVQLSAAALAALESSQRRHGELRGVDEAAS